MKLRYSSLLLALCMAFYLLPITATAEPSFQARWSNAGEEGEIPVNWTSSGSLADAVNAANNSITGIMYIQLLSDVNTAGLTFTASNASILDLNGRTLSCDSDNTVLHEGSGKLTITDSSSEKKGKVTNQSTDSDTIFLYGSSLVIEGGTVENTGVGFAINNCSFGSVEITGDISNPLFPALLALVALCGMVITVRTKKRA
ncbi:MAG: hypothetical protein PHW77_07315 [Eubacteriales bacterium]|nr:hypothetical protein [Eubacteriales bacterium]